MLKFFVLLSSIFMLSMSSGSKKRDPGKNGINFDSKKTVFDNGLTLISVKNNKMPIFSLFVYYNVGGKFETKGITGASHYLEHMMFKGAKKYGPGQFDYIIEGNGGSNNAYTTNDMTVYHENIPKQHLETILDVEADRMQNLLLEPRAFENERQVVLEERKMRYENKDRGKLYLAMMENMFEGTPYGTSVIGNIEDLKTVTREQMYEYFKKFYAPNNAIIVVAGDLEHGHVLNLVKKYFSKIPKTDMTKYKDAERPERFKFQGKYNRSISLKGTSPTPSFMLAFKGLPVGPRESYVMDIFSSIVGDGNSSFLNQTFVKNAKPKLSYVYAHNYTLQNSGVFYVAGQLVKGVSLKYFKKSLIKSLKESCESAIDSRSVQKVKNRYLIDFLSGLETNKGVARFLGDREIFYGDYLFFDKELETYNSITEDEIKSACKKYISVKDSIFLSIWNKHKGK